MKIFMFTSVPVTPPWDQGDKNLAYTLASAIPDIQFKILTDMNSENPNGKNLEAMPVYRSLKPTIAHKARVFEYLPKAMSGASAVHLIYRPYWLSAWLLQLSPHLRKSPKLHTVPATADGRSLHPSLFFAEKTVAISEFGKSKLLQAGLENVHFIPAGIRADEWIGLSRDIEIYKRHLGLSGHPVVLFPGHYGNGQGADMMLQAIAKLVVLIPEIRFIFACRIRSYHDEEKERLHRQRLREQGLDYSVRFFHRVSDMKKLIGACDLVALPLETMREKIDIPITLLECLAAGKPVVISDIPPMNELIHRSSSGVNCIGQATPPGDVRALVEAIATLIIDDRLRKNMAKAGEALIRECYNIERISFQYRKLYQEITD